MSLTAIVATTCLSGSGGLFSRFWALPQIIMQYHICKGSVSGHLWMLLYCKEENSDSIGQDLEGASDHCSAPGYSTVRNPFIFK